MHTSMKVLLVSSLFTTGILLQGCSDSNEEDEPVAQNEATTEVREGATETTSTERSSAPSDAEITIMSPEDGASVGSPVTVKFGLEGMEVAEAGSDQENSGHHHLLVDLDELPPMDSPLPSTEQIIHFGGGQTSTELELEPGKHTLQLLLGDSIHVPHEPPIMSEKITITVE
ncbi:MAG: DUF4399 domain-containing protein [Marinobacter sp.]|uniref:DUF4399 domain-containing protein n=1 Tax=Marinobacter sp. TaxID=50741 RepID=UPI0034A03AE3